MAEFDPVADGVYVLRYPVLDVNCTLVVGGERALLVDTLSTPTQGRELTAAVRRVTRLPVVVVNTHYHFDHVFGNGAVAQALGAEEFWAHEYTIAMLRDDDDHVRIDGHQTCLELAPDIAYEVGNTFPLIPGRSVTTDAEINLGGRTARLWHPGPAHTRGDLVVFADTVTIAGDLVEQSGPVSVEDDSEPDNWPDVLTLLLERVAGPVVPGHGAVVDAEFVRWQRDQLSAGNRGEPGQRAPDPLDG